MPRPERPLDPNASAIARFAAELRALRQEAGNPSYRELAKLAHYSPTALSEAAGGERLGSLPVTLAYVRACGGDLEWWEARWRAAVAEAGRRPHTGGPEPRACPYGYPVMLAGRDRLVAAVLDRIAAGTPVAVSGPSGAGTTSVLRAGVVPALGRGSTAGWPIVFLEPGEDPLEELSVHLAALLSLTAGLVHTELESDCRALHRLLRQALVSHPPGTCVVLIVDQFEQLVTRCRDEGRRLAFLCALETVCQADPSRVRLVLGVREDVLWHNDFGAHPGILAVLGNPLTVGGLDREALRRAIIGPAAGAGVTVEGALTTMLVADTHGRPGGLALLATTLCELWPHREGHRLTHTAYRAVDGVNGVLGRTAESTYQSLAPAQQEVARRALLRLSALNTSAWLDRTEFNGGDTALESLAAQRIIVLGVGGVALAHEALPAVWPRLRGWLDSNPDCLRIHRGLADAARDWRRLGRDRGALLKGPGLVSTLDWASAGGAGELNSLELEFLEASRAAMPRKGRAWFRFAATALTVVLLAGSAASRSATFSIDVALTVTQPGFRAVSVTSIKSAQGAGSSRIASRPKP
ncbi:MAG TPA: XRE family transcriptional regulator [Candidatus Limnocylindrales bacterium]|nr:XRE family transcriptional regulator [Candidatus Limnocylindrales bacterium]